MDWTANRMLAKTNYRIHTDSIKQNIVPKITENQKKYIYAEEADVLNVVLLGMTAKEWKEINPGFLQIIWVLTSAIKQTDLRLLAL